MSALLSLFFIVSEQGISAVNQKMRDLQVTLNSCTQDVLIEKVDLVHHQKIVQAYKAVEFPRIFASEYI